MNDITWRTTGGDEVTVYDAPDGWRWRVRAANGEIVGSGESHPWRADAIAAAERHHPRVTVAEPIAERVKRSIDEGEAELAAELGEEP